MLEMRSSPHLDFCVSAAKVQDHGVLNGWKDSEMVPPSTQYEFSCVTIQQLVSKESSSDWLEDQSSDSQTWPQPYSSDASLSEVQSEDESLHCFLSFVVASYHLFLVELLACTIV